MHFAQTLDASVIPEWKSRYVNFTEGKDLISKIDRSLPEPEPIPEPAVKSAPQSNADSLPYASSMAFSPLLEQLPSQSPKPGPSKTNAPETDKWELPPPALTRAASSGSHGKKWVRKIASKVNRLNSPVSSPVSKLFRTPDHLPAAASMPTPNLLTHAAFHVGEQEVSASAAHIFFNWLNSEVMRANDFYTEMLLDSRDKLKMLSEQLKIFEQHRTLHHGEREVIKHPKASKQAKTFLERLDLPSVPLKLRFFSSDTSEANTYSLRNAIYGIPFPSTIKNKQRTRALRVAAHTSDFSNSSDSVGYYQAKSMLKLAHSEFYQSLQQLDGFQKLNMTAIRKIVKKFDKQICDKHHWKHTENQYMAEVSELPMCNDAQEIPNMILQVEQMYASHFTQGNRKRAVDTLRFAAMGEQERHPGATLFAGVAYGISIPLAILAVYGALHNRNQHQHTSKIALNPTTTILNQDNTSTIQSVFMAIVDKFTGPDETTYLLQILAGFALVAVFLTGFSIAITVWTAYRVNYAFILELDRTTMISPPQFSFLASLYTLLVSLCAYLTFNTTESFHRYYPCLVLGISVLVLALPFGPYWPSRLWLLHSLWRLLFSGLYPVEFRDLLTGDLMCSLTYSLSNMEMFFCVYAASPKWWTIDGSIHAQRCTSSHSRAMGFLNCLPGIWRFLQCWRRFFDTLDWFPHLLNAGKYTFNILYNMSLSLARISPHNDGLKGFFIAMALINGVYSGSWDVLMDFSLTPSFSRKLRSTLVFPNWWYWIVMFEDMLLRQNWILYVVFWNHKGQSAYISFIVALIEITRRCIWAMFRVENEHSANIMRCRAFKNLHLPYDNVLKTIPSNSSTSQSSTHRDSSSASVKNTTGQTGQTD